MIARCNWRWTQSSYYLGWFWLSERIFYSNAQCSMLSTIQHQHHSKYILLQMAWIHRRAITKQCFVESVPFIFPLCKYNEIVCNSFFFFYHRIPYSVCACIWCFCGVLFLSFFLLNIHSFRFLLSFIFLFGSFSHHRVNKVYSAPRPYTASYSSFWPIFFHFVAETLWSLLSATEPCALSEI